MRLVEPVARDARVDAHQQCAGRHGVAGVRAELEDLARRLRLQLDRAGRARSRRPPRRPAPASRARPSRSRTGSRQAPRLRGPAARRAAAAQDRGPAVRFMTAWYPVRVVSLTIRPSIMRRVRCARAATSASWVTTRTVLPARCSSSNSARISSPVAVSRLPVGSSASSRLGLRDQRPRDGHALPLAARELGGPVLRALREADARRAPRRRAVRGRGAAARHRPAAARRSAAPWRAAAARTTGTRSRSRGCARGRAARRACSDTSCAVEPVAALVGRVEAAEQVHERRLAGARRPHDGRVLAALDHEVDAAQRVDRLAAHPVAAQRGLRCGSAVRRCGTHGRSLISRPPSRAP